jgi:hypothetical protein
MQFGARALPQCAALLFGMLAMAVTLQGCVPTIASVASGGLAVGEYAGIKAGEKAHDLHVPGPPDEQQQRCDELAADPPGVEEVRNHDGVIESREWRMVPGEGAPKWQMIAETGADKDGWAPKPGISKLGFKPPLSTLLDGDEPQFLAYAPSTVETVADSRRMTVVTEAFGPAVGTFQWRGRSYGFALVKVLPCFKQLK